MIDLLQTFNLSDFRTQWFNDTVISKIIPILEKLMAINFEKQSCGLTDFSFHVMNFGQYRKKVEYYFSMII